MGLKYRLNCYKCHKWSNWIEFSITDKYSIKTIPDGLLLVASSWVPFLFQHVDHGRLDLIDERGEQTDPTQLKGKHVLGLEKSPKRINA